MKNSRCLLRRVNGWDEFFSVCAVKVVVVEVLVGEGAICVDDFADNVDVVAEDEE